MKSLLAPLGLCALLAAGCTDGSPESAATHDPSSSPSQVPVLAGQGAHLEPGTYRVSANPDGPDLLLDVAKGFASEEDWYVVSYDRSAFLGLLTVDVVDHDPCSRGAADVRELGPAVGDLVGALVSQRSTRASEPKPVRLAGHTGTYLEMRGPRDLTGCRKDPELMEGRGIYGPGQVDLLWILDVDGERLVVDAGYARDAAQADVDRLRTMVASLREAA